MRIRGSWEDPLVVADLHRSRHNPYAMDRSLFTEREYFLTILHLFHDLWDRNQRPIEALR